MAKYLDNEGVLYLWNKIKAKFVAQESGKGLSTNDYTTTEKNKLAGLSNYTHPSHTAKTSGLYKVTVDALGHVSGTTAVAKSDITALGIPAQDTTYSNATTEASGLMSASDKTKLNGIQEGAEKNVFTGLGQDANSSNEPNPYWKILNTKGADIRTPTFESGLIARSVLPVVTTSKQGVMSASDKTKLDGIAEGANNYTHPSSHSASMITQDSTHRFVSDTEKSTWNAKAGTSVATASANGLMSSTMFSKLNALPTNATLQSTYALKSEITGMYKYKGTVTNESNLPTSNTVGDVYNITNASSYGGAGMNVVWTGTAWDALGEVFNIDSITNTELDTICV